ncbi:hypothetical protein BH09BAC2_BH09BAC2_10900 [soil metagenome]
MSFENFPTGSEPERKTTTTVSSTTPKRPNNDYRNIIIGVLALALLGTIGYLIWGNNKHNQETQLLNSQIVNSDSSRNEIQRELNDATMQIDMLKSTNARADSVIRTKENEIADLKQRVTSILNDKNASASQLAEARRLIATLKTNISTYTAEIERLQGEKIVLTQQKRIVTEERDVARQNYDSAQTVIRDRENVIDIGSTLHANNFTIAGVKERNGREKITTTAKRVDKLKITFDIDENRIARSGAKDLYISITDPDGQPVVVEALGSGKFVTRDGVEKLFTKKVQINYVQGQRQTVPVEWKQNSEFKPGDYKIEVYNNGFKIGEAVRTFKKGGLFG